ncbi:MAG: hypothetical protein K2L13_00110, partial [Opitutales bacterium]|nr:hypothetical protein [Opitutales bacterium]
MKSQSYNPNIPSDTSIISQPTDSKGVTATSRTSPEQSSQKTAETNLTTREKNFINSFKDADVEKLEKAVKRLEEEWKKSERKESENISRAVKDEFQNSNDSKLGEKLLTFLGEFETVQKEFLQRDELAKTLQPNETSQKNEFSAKAIRNFIQGALQTSKNTEQKVPTITEVENKVEAFFNVFDLHETSDKKGANISEEEMKNPEYLKLIIDKLDVIETRINLIKNTEWKEWN